MLRKTVLTRAFMVFSVGFFCMAIPLGASARDMNGKFGLGLDVSSGGVSGLGMRYFVSNVKIDLTLGVNAFIPSGSGDTQLGFYTAPAVIYEFARSRKANLGIGLRANLGYKNKAANNGSSTFEVNIEIPLEAEYYFTSHFAMNFSVSLLFDIVPASGRILKNKGASGQGVPSQKGFGISFGAGSLIAGAGFTYYF